MKKTVFTDEMIMDIIINENSLDKLRSAVASQMGEKRFFHTLGVEREIDALSDIYCKEKKNILRAAALLHDITKERDAEYHLGVMAEHGLCIEYYKAQNYKTYHSVTAALLIPELYPEFADEEIIEAVRLHTTGDVGMSLSDKLLYLADYIEPTRTFDDCVRLREYFYSLIEHGEDKYRVLDKTLLLSFDMTISDLIKEKRSISNKTVDARNDILAAIKKGE